MWGAPRGPCETRAESFGVAGIKGACQPGRNLATAVSSLRAGVTFQPPAAHRGWVLPCPEERLPGGVRFAEIPLKRFGCARGWGPSGHPSRAVKAAAV